MDIASALGIGLIQIAPRVAERYFRRRHRPIPRLQLAGVFEKMGYGEVLHLSDLVPVGGCERGLTISEICHRAGIVKAAKNKKGLFSSGT